MANTTHSHPAEIVFEQQPAPRGKDIADRWHGRLLKPYVVDTQGNPEKLERVGKVIAKIDEYESGNVQLTIQGGSKGSRRYRSFSKSQYDDPVTAAQEHAIRWAGRRFRLPCTEGCK